MAKFQVGDKVTVVQRYDRNGSVCWFHGEVKEVLQMHETYYGIHTEKTGDYVYVNVNEKGDLIDECSVTVPRIDDAVEIFTTCVSLASPYIERRRLRLKKHIAREAVKVEKDFLIRELESLAMMQVVESSR
jgi:hypothetical protein